MPLSAKQERFVEEYLVDLNATQAAIRAGYSKKTAKAIGSENLTKPDIAEEVTRRRALVSAGCVVTRERVLQELARIGMSDIRKLYDEKGKFRKITELDDDTAAAIAGVEFEELFEGAEGERFEIGRITKIKRFDKSKALEMLGRHLGLWKDPEAPAQEGPGLTVIVQQVAAAGAGGAAANRVVVSLAPPERSR